MARQRAEEEEAERAAEEGRRQRRAEMEGRMRAREAARKAAEAEAARAAAEAAELAAVQAAMERSRREAERARAAAMDTPGAGGSKVAEVDDDVVEVGERKASRGVKRKAEVEGVLRRPKPAEHKGPKEAEFAEVPGEQCDQCRRVGAACLWPLVRARSKACIRCVRNRHACKRGGVNVKNIPEQDHPSNLRGNAAPAPTMSDMALLLAEVRGLRADMQEAHHQRLRMVRYLRRLDASMTAAAAEGGDMEWQDLPCRFGSSSEDDSGSSSGDESEGGGDLGAELAQEVSELVAESQGAASEQAGEPEVMEVDSASEYVGSGSESESDGGVVGKGKGRA